MLEGSCRAGGGWEGSCGRVGGGGRVEVGAGVGELWDSRRAEEGESRVADKCSETVAGGREEEGGREVADGGARRAEVVGWSGGGLSGQEAAVGE